MALHPASIERLERLKKILEKMVDSGVIWSKSLVCRELKVDRAFLCPRASWQVSQEASKLYREACEQVKENNRLELESNHKAYGVTWRRIDSMQQYCEELTAYNKQIRRAASREIRALKLELQKERDRVAELEAQLARSQSSQQEAA